MFMGMTAQRRAERRFHRQDKPENWLANRLAAIAVVCALGSVAVWLAFPVLAILSGVFGAH